MLKEDRPSENSSLDTSNNIVFKNEMFLVAIDKKSMIFENVKNYQLWGNYFAFIKNVINSISDQDIQSSVERVGIRYISFFAKTDKVTMILKKPFLMVEDEIGEITDSSFYGNFTFQRNLYRCSIQIGNKIQFPGESDVKEGCVIDLDVSISDNLPRFKTTALFDIIDSLHDEEKGLFVAVMSEDFLNSLTIKY
ncbi:TIGR04255 family protein [Spirosoma endophyticum]|uniref:TIGR04255 family protein n=2 Tax=Spirosoma endophyticum TaxID=662367 RepID=A0A1I2H5N1_9BACT|nr:TIGR04255 family protein [Spirosoma endophyticum]